MMNPENLTALLHGVRGDFANLRDDLNKSQGGLRRQLNALDTRVNDLSTEIERRPTRTEALNLKNQGADLGSDRPDGLKQRFGNSDLKAMLGDYVRSGQIRDELSSSVGTDGGFLVVTQHADQMLTKLFDVSPVADLATRVVLNEGNMFEMPVGVNLPGAEWVGETETRTQTTDPSFTLQRIPVHEIYSLIKVPQSLLDDAHYDLEGFILDAMQTKFSISIGAAFINGNVPAKQPVGILQSTFATTDDEVRAWGTVQTMETTVAGLSADDLIDFVYKLRAPYRGGAAWFMNRKSAGVVRKLKDEDGRFVWADSLAKGQPATLLGYPVYLDEQLADIGAGAYPIMFGNMAQAFTMVMRNDARFLRDPFTQKGFMLLYAYLRVGGALVNSEALKVMKFTA